MAESDKIFFDAVVYKNSQKKIVGYAYGTDKGNICVKLNDMVDGAAIGRILKKNGLYIMERKKKKSP